jgi:uncharacterized protein (DUF924 family)/GNAT superfamily N-acetyltransferase
MEWLTISCGASNHAPMSFEIRAARESELDALATVWYEAWQDGHAAVVPAELTRRRTRERFRDRLQAALADVRVAGPIGAPVGFSMLKDDELYQLFVSARARGSGVAAALIADAEARVAAKGIQTAWLTCAIGNDRAARFYEKCGWHRTGTVTEELDTPEGTLRMDVWRYEKRLAVDDPDGVPAASPEAILQFWFGDAAQSPAKADARTSFWFTPSAETDAECRERFRAQVEAAARGHYDSWTQTPRSALALVVLLDQFPRNIWRGTGRAFAHDAQALAVARQAVASGFMPRLAPIEQPFLTLPFQHSESLDAQRESLRLCEEIDVAAPPDWQPVLQGFVPYARQHFEIIERFGRFPHRNAVLGRASTAAEQAYLARGGETFGQG